MSLKELFPIYPLSLRSPPRHKVKFGTRNLYVDFPWQAYYFLQRVMDKSMETDLVGDKLKEMWYGFVNDNKDHLMFSGKPLASVLLIATRHSPRTRLELIVDWKLFVQYLEQKAIDFLRVVGKHGQEIMRIYRCIWINFFGMFGRITPSRTQYFPHIRERFRELLKRTGDYSQIEHLLHQFEEMIEQVEDAMKDDIPPIQFYTTNLIMNIQHLHSLIDVANIPACYLLLRNMLENFVKLYVYLDIGKTINPIFVLISMFLYEYETTVRPGIEKPRTGSLIDFKDKFTRKILSIASTLPYESELDGLKIIEKLREKGVPTLLINPNVLEAFCESHGLNVALCELYSACSAIIHNQPPLPFFSLLEVKFFKHFLENYTESLKVMTEKLMGFEKALRQR